MKIHRILTNQKGLSLFLVVLIFVTIGLIAFGAATLSIRLQKTGKETATIKRMHVVRDALKRYYRGHQDLPAAASVPVGDLNLEQKYRLDAWGQELHYNMVTKVKEGTTDQITDIVGLDVDDINVAGVIISSGPDQTRQTTGPPYTTTDDDIVVPVNLSAVAKEIALSQMDVIRRKLWAFAVSHPAGSSPPASFWSDYGLPDSYTYDPWGNRYVLGSENVTSIGDGFSLPVLTKDNPPPLALGGGNFNKGSGDTVDFGGGGAFQGTLQGATWSAEGDTPTGSGYALSFDGTNDYVDAGNSSLLNFDTDDAFSISVWVNYNRSDPTRIQPIVTKMSRPDKEGWRLQIQNSECIRFILQPENAADNGSIELQTITKIEPTEWYHIVATYDGSSKASGAKIYVNGSPQNTRIVNEKDEILHKASIANDAPVLIGANAYNKRFYGLIDNLAIYDKALSSSEVKDIY